MKNDLMSHVDTLYLYYKCTYDEYIKALGVFAGYPIISYAKGYDWYDFGIARVGLMDYNKAKIANTYPIVIQYNAIYLMTIHINDLKLFFSPHLDQYIIKRIDYAYTFNVSMIDFDLIDSIVVSRYFRKSSVIYGSDRKKETLYLGLRRTGKVFRLYNKSKELIDKNNHEKQQILNHHFGTLDNLFVYEIELHRKYLRDRCNIDTLAQIDKLNSVVYTLFSSLQFCEDTEENVINIKNNNYNRIDFRSPFLDIIKTQEFDFVPVKRYEKSKDFLLKSLYDTIKQYNSKDGHKISIEELLSGLASQQDNINILEVDIKYDKYIEEDIS